MADPELENLYMESLSLRIIREPLPISPIEAEEGDLEDGCNCEDEELTENEEVEIAEEILDHVDELKEIAKDAMYKTYKEKIENCAKRIEELAKELIDAHE